MEWSLAPEGHTHVSRWLQRTNWAQGMEGEIDSSHIGFLHRVLDPAKSRLGGDMTTQDPAPVMTLKETDYGFMYGSRRKYESQYYWRVTQWLMPMYSLIPSALANSGAFFGSGRCWVPIDDHHTTTFAYRFREDRPHTTQEIADLESGWFFPPRLQRGSFELPHGYKIDTFLPVANRENDFLIDREMQKTVNYTGIHGLNEQDRSLQEGMPSRNAADKGIVDRSRENLVSSDVPVATARRKLIAMATALRDGAEPVLPFNGDAYSVRALGKLSQIGELDPLLDSCAPHERHAATDHATQGAKVR